VSFRTLPTPRICIGVLLGAGSQALDSVVAVSSSEFVAEETLKLAAEAFLIGGFLVALRDLRDREPVQRSSGTAPAQTSHV
jgi:hypothetical protein